MLGKPITFSAKPPQREIYIDVLRILACLMVIFNHTLERGFYRFSDFSFPLYPVHFSASLICKTAVPLFFMISGALLLGKEESISRTYARIPKMLIDLILFSFLYRWTESILGGWEFSFEAYLILLVKEGYWHLWYLYAYIIFLVTLPFLRKMVRSLDYQSVLYLFVLAVLAMGIPPILSAFWEGIYASVIPSWVTVNIFIYPVMGYAADRILDIDALHWKHFAVLWAASSVGLLISYRCQVIRLLSEPGSIDETFLINFCLIYTVTLFLTVKKLFFGKQPPVFLCNAITQIGQTTYAVYLLHVLFLYKIPFFTRIWAALESFNGFMQLFGVYISCLTVFIICCILGLILRKLPVIRRLF